MNLSTPESTIKYLKKAIPKEGAYEFIFNSIPLLYELFCRMDSYEIELILEDKDWSHIYTFVIDIMEAYQMQEAERELKEKNTWVTLSLQN